MKERPILFSVPMVRAILDGRKTQTRRIVKPQPGDIGAASLQGPIRWRQHIPVWCYTSNSGKIGIFNPSEITCPHGADGDRFWVRESWRTSRTLNHVKPSMLAPGAPILFDSDGWADGFPLGFDKGKGRPSIFMPRWASRITLEITGVRVERVQDITEADAMAEGCDLMLSDGRAIRDLPDADLWDYRMAFEGLWDSINGKRKDKDGNSLPYSFSDNPFVWVITFKRV